MKVRVAIKLFAPLAAAVLVAAACAAKPEQAKPETAKATGSAVITVVAKDYAYEMPAVVPAGVTTIEVVNQGREMHHLQIAKVDSGHTVNDLIAALGQHTPPSWAVAMGGPNAIEPGQKATTIQTLTPGHYVVLCLIPGADGAPHFMKGMTGAFEVVPSPVASAEEPKADATFDLADYSFGHPSISAGQRIIRVENGAQQPHELVLVKLDAGKSAGDVLQWFAAGMKSAPPGHFVSGVVALSPGQHSFFSYDFAAGNYGLLCFVEDVKDGKPHVMHGMMSQFTVPTSVAVKN